MEPDGPRCWRDFTVGMLSFGPLVTAQDVLAGAAGMEAYDIVDRQALGRLAQYMTEFLTGPDPRIGRAGPVCPFTSGALRRGMMRLTASRLADADAVMDEMSWLRDAYLKMVDHSIAGEVFRSISVVFPRMDVAVASRMIEDVQHLLKPSYVEHAVMLGQFYPDCPSPGLHNPAFRPLQTPVPCFTIRHMTEGDAPFMLADERFVAAYVRRFPKDGPDRIAMAGGATCPVRTTASIDA